MHMLEPTQDSSSKVSGPEGSGESFDISSGKLAEGQPQTVPYAKHMKLAENINILLIIDYRTLSRTNSFSYRKALQAADFYIWQRTFSC